MELVDLFNIIDIIINYQKCDEIIEKSKKEFVNVKYEQDVNNILLDYKRLIDKWYNWVIIKSVFLFLSFILLIILFYVLCNYFNVFSVFLAVVSLIVCAGIIIIVYIIDKVNNKSKIKNDLYKKLEEVSYKYKPKYDKIRIY